jgi:hypothetical protein
MNDLKRQIYWVDFHARVSKLCRLLIVSMIGFIWFQMLTHDRFISGSIFVIILGAGILKLKLYQSNLSHAIHLIHAQVSETEYSLELLFKPQLNIAEQLQRDRIVAQSQSLQLPIGIYYRGTLKYIIALIASVLLFYCIPFAAQQWSSAENVQGGTPTQSNYKVVNKDFSPQYIGAQVRIDAPAYTEIKSSTTSDLNIQAIIGSQITWQVKFNHSSELRLSLLNVHGEEIAFEKKEDAFVRNDRITGSGIYYIKGYWKDSLIYQSAYYSMEAIADQSPKIDPSSKELYRFHVLGDPLHVNVSAKISDDFMVREAFIVATLARGSGENVKFREMKIPLHQQAFKSQNIQKQIDLNALNFSPGDELYYYWAAIDNRLPEPNFSKSDTYFLVYKDTAQIEESELATLAVNIVPEYFRSQRQIIIDTEKLIAKRKKIPAKQFGEISNEIGFDQKVLRLRYGQFLGEEFETNIGGAGHEAGASTGESGNILEGFIHHSDGHGEGKAEAPHQSSAHHEDHHDHETATGEKDPLAALMDQYLHAHDDSEINTFYEASTKSLLKMALEQMWNSELNLRLYKPEMALPYELKALEYLKEAQQKARTFVKKSGYDPPPIKEHETRMTGDMKGVILKYHADKVSALPQVNEVAAQLLSYLELTSMMARQQKVCQENSIVFKSLIPKKQWNENIPMFILLNKLGDGIALKSEERNALKNFLSAYTDRQIKARDLYQGNGLLEKKFWDKLH